MTKVKFFRLESVLISVIHIKLGKVQFNLFIHNRGWDHLVKTLTKNFYDKYEAEAYYYATNLKSSLLLLEDYGQMNKQEVI